MRFPRSRWAKVAIALRAVILIADIGAQHGPFDLTLLKIGADGEGWPERNVR